MHKIASSEEWSAARRELLDEEKAFQKARDKLARKRRELSWREVDSDYVFATEAGPVEYNYRVAAGRPEELPGISVFIRDGDNVYHSYSTYARGLDPYNATYQLLDIVPKGCDEDELQSSMGWLRRSDEY